MGGLGLRSFAAFGAATLLAAASVRATAEPADTQALTPSQAESQAAAAFAAQVYPDALRLSLIAAKGGETGAMVRLGDIYAHGYTVPEDDGQALAWYRKAADKGVAAAQYHVGLIYQTGQGTATD
jgi:TPR repeat protein